MRITPIVLAGALLALPATGQNLLTNPDFEAGLSGWGAFGNASAQPSTPPQFVPRSGTQLVSMFGNFSGGFNVSGIFQSFPASAGQSYTIDAWARHWDQDPLLGNGPPNDNWVVKKIAFFDAGGAEIAGFEDTILSGTSPTNTWINTGAVSGTAPANTASVQALILFLQPGSDGGAAHIDDVSFTGPPSGSAAYPGTADDLRLSTGVAGVAATSGAGNDVKTANAGDALEINVASPGGAYNLTPYYVFAQPFTTGNPPTPPIFLPNAYFRLSQPIGLLVDGSNGFPFGPPVIGATAGTSTFYVTPSGLSGMSVIVQGFVFAASANNGAYAATDAHEIQL